MEFERYQLPSGEIVDCDATATKGASMIRFTLKGGQIVMAKRVREERNGRCVCGCWISDHFTTSNRKISCEQAAQAAKGAR